MISVSLFIKKEMTIRLQGLLQWRLYAKEKKTKPESKPQ